MKIKKDTDPPEISPFLWNGFRLSKLGFDVGANCGQSVKDMLRLCRHVISFEPNVQSFGELARAWEDNTRVDYWRVAVTDHDGEVTLAQLPGEMAETGQLVTPGLIGMEWTPDDWSAVPEVRCPARTLDSLAVVHGIPGIVKVDTEGHEVLILRGAAQLLEARETSWLIEFHSPENHDECERVLAGAGYEPRTFRHPHYRATQPMYLQHGWIKALAPD